MGLAVAHVEIRDQDLVQRLAAATPFMREVEYRWCLEEQRRRDALSAMSPVKRRRSETARLIKEQKEPDRQDLRHIHSALAICSLPYTRQDIAVREWERKQGRMSLRVTAGELMGEHGNWVQQPLPFGSRARLILIHTCSEAIRQKSPEIEIEDSLSGFMRAMGLQVTGGKNGSLTAFKEQVNALAACSMRMGLWDETGAKTVNTQPFSSIDVLFPRANGQPALWSSKLTFSQEFFQTLTKHALPINMHALRAFASSPRKLDLLFWLGYRLHVKNKVMTISWEALRDQFGKGYSRADNFQRDFNKEIAEIKEVFPKLPVTLNHVGVTIMPSTIEVLSLPPKVRKL